jgi:uncharacterized glyoxalase superfamily protein PhnB
MKISASAISLTVDDVAASSAFLVKHFGFTEYSADDQRNFASLGREDVGVTVIFLRRGCEVLPESYRNLHVAGLIIAFTVNEIEAEQERLKTEGVAITLPLMEESWGERLFQVTDPNGVIFQLVEWSGDNPHQ